MNLHEYIGDGWGSSHPADFTPACTTELGAFANRNEELTKRRDTRLIGGSADYGESHKGWSGDSPTRKAPHDPQVLPADHSPAQPIDAEATIEHRRLGPRGKLVRTTSAARTKVLECGEASTSVL